MRRDGPFADAPVPVDSGGLPVAGACATPGCLAERAAPAGAAARTTPARSENTSVSASMPKVLEHHVTKMNNFSKAKQLVSLRRPLSLLLALHECGQESQLYVFLGLLEMHAAYRPEEAEGVLPGSTPLLVFGQLVPAKRVCWDDLLPLPRTGCSAGRQRARARRFSVHLVRSACDGCRTWQSRGVSKKGLSQGQEAFAIFT